MEGAQSAKGGDITMDELSIVRCGKDQGILNTAHAAGYTSPTHRVGNMPQSQPLPWEEIVAWVRANQYSAPYPIFAKIQAEE